MIVLIIVLFSQFTIINDKISKGKNKCFVITCLPHKKY
jgi:hypothetical protein